MLSGSEILPVFILCNILPILAAYAMFTQRATALRSPYRKVCTPDMASLLSGLSYQGTHCVGISGQT